MSVLKLEKEILSNAEKRACDEVRSLSERVYRLQVCLKSNSPTFNSNNWCLCSNIFECVQATLDTIQSAEEAREVGCLNCVHHVFLYFELV